MIPDKTRGARRPEQETDRTNVTQAPEGKVYELHPANDPDRSSSDVDQRRESPDLPEKAEGRFQQTLEG